MVTRRDVMAASQNWENLRKIFEHKCSPQKNPLFCKKDFYKFLSNYSVGRTIQRGKRDKFRTWLISSNFDLTAMINDATGKTLDQNLVKVTKKFGTIQKRKNYVSRGSRRAPISLVSKIASFLAPDKFIAWDTYARKGLNIELSHSKWRPFPSYAAYLKDINFVMSCSVGNQVRATCKKYASKKLAKSRSFHLRVLDQYLMRKGGRPAVRVPKSKICLL
jgi:hypothetical protein